MILDSLGYKLATGQRNLTPLQRLILLYGYAYLNAQTLEEKKETRSLEDLANILPRE